jgi:hypothetical protein
METNAARFTGDDWRVLFNSKPLRHLYLGRTLCGLAANSRSIWGATFFARNYGVSLLEIGTVLGVYLSDRLRRFGRGRRMGVSALLGAPLWVVMLFS